MDWTTSFKAITDKARLSYEGLAGRWQELLGKAARGELAHLSLQDRLPGFLQDEGAEFYRRLGSLSFELFQGLSEAQARSTNDFMRGLLGDSAGTDSPAQSAPTPPVLDAEPAKWTLWYQEVTAFITQQNESALNRYQVLLEKVADGKLTPASVREFSRKFISERTLVFSRDAGELQMRFCEKLLQLNQEFVESLFASLVRDGSAPFDSSNQTLCIELAGSSDSTDSAGAGDRFVEASKSNGAASPTQVIEPADFRPAAEKSSTLLLVGPLGGRASALLTLTNESGADAQVRCTVGNVRRADGVGPAFAPKVITGRPAFTLAPGASKKLSLSVRLDSSIYEIGPAYIGSVRVTGLGKAAIITPFQIIAQEVSTVPPKPRKKSPAKGLKRKP